MYVWMSNSCKCGVSNVTRNNRGNMSTELDFHTQFHTTRLCHVLVKLSRIRSILDTADISWPRTVIFFYNKSLCISLRLPRNSWRSCLSYVSCLHVYNLSQYNQNGWNDQTNLFTEILLICSGTFLEIWVILRSLEAQKHSHVCNIAISSAIYHRATSILYQRNISTWSHVPRST